MARLLAAAAAAAAAIVALSACVGVEILTPTSLEQQQAVVSQLSVVANVVPGQRLLLLPPCHWFFGCWCLFSSVGSSSLAVESNFGRRADGRRA